MPKSQSEFYHYRKRFERVPDLCKCGSGHEAYWLYDARGIPLTKACGLCEDDKLSRYRPDVIADPNYWADEDIEEGL